jgi:hypothetical protein
MRHESLFWSRRTQCTWSHDTSLRHILISPIHSCVYQMVSERILRKSCVFCPRMSSPKLLGGWQWNFVWGLRVKFVSGIQGITPIGPVQYCAYMKLKLNVFLKTTSSKKIIDISIKLTTWSRILLQKPTVSKLLNNLSTFYETRRFISLFIMGATGP